MGSLGLPMPGAGDSSQRSVGSVASWKVRLWCWRSLPLSGGAATCSASFFRETVSSGRSGMGSVVRERMLFEPTERWLAELPRLARPRRVLAASSSAFMLGLHISCLAGDDGPYRGRSEARVLGRSSSDRSRVGDLSADGRDLLGLLYIGLSGSSTKPAVH